MVESMAKEDSLGNKVEDTKENTEMTKNKVMDSQ
jgi:hypothetical protein